MKNANSVKEFYQKLGIAGLKILTSPKKTTAYIAFLKKQLLKNKKILDVACGYGRLTIPLAKQGYKITGIDIAPNLIKEAKRLAQKEKVSVSFKSGDMCKLPYKNGSFDAIICMWSSFNHILTQEDQLQALREMYRVVVNNGLIIIDMPYFTRPTKTMLKKGVFLDKNCHLYQEAMGKLKNVVYLHNKESLQKILSKAKITDYKIKAQNIDKRKRLILYIFKNPY